MGKRIIVKPIINKRNNQINISLPKKELSKKLIDKIFDTHELKIQLEDWD